MSGFVALTLTPMMCSKLLKHQARHSAIYNVTERFFVAMNSGYRGVLGTGRGRWWWSWIFLGVGSASPASEFSCFEHAQIASSRRWRTAAGS